MQSRIFLSTSPAKFLAAMLLAALSSGAAAQDVALKISSFTPPPHWTNSQLFQPWAKEL